MDRRSFIASLIGTYAGVFVPIKALAVRKNFTRLDIAKEQFKLFTCPLHMLSFYKLGIITVKEGIIWAPPTIKVDRDDNKFSLAFEACGFKIEEGICTVNGYQLFTPENILIKQGYFHTQVKLIKGDKLNVYYTINLHMGEI